MRRALLIFIAVLLGVIAFVATAPGKRLLALAIEKLVESSIHGTLSVGELRGNLWKDLTFSRLVLRKKDGEQLAAIDEAVVRFHVHRAFPPIVVIEKLEVVNPDLQVRILKNGKLNWEELFAAEAAPPKPAEEPEPAPVELETLEVRGGRVVIRGRELGKVEVEQLETALRFDQDRGTGLVTFPIGRLALRGDWDGIPLSLLAKITRQEAAAANRLSAIQKQIRPAGRAVPPRELEVSATVGRSRVEARVEGVFPFADPDASSGQAMISRLHLDKKARPRVLSSLPDKDLDAKGRLEFEPGRFFISAQAALEPLLKAVVEGELIREKASTVAEVRRLRVNGKCPLLANTKPTRLVFGKDEPVPTGNLNLRGCAGTIAYTAAPDGLVSIALKDFSPSTFADALALQGVPEKLGKIDATLRFPRGMRTRLASFEGLWRIPERIPQELPASSQEDQEVVRISGRLDGRTTTLEVETRFQENGFFLEATAQDLFAPETLAIEPERATLSLQAHSEDLDLDVLSKLGLKVPLSGPVQVELEARGRLTAPRLALKLGVEEAVLVAYPGAAPSAADHRFQFQGQLDHDGRAATAGATVHWTERQGEVAESSGPLRLDASLQGTVLEVLGKGKRNLRALPLLVHVWSEKAGFDVARFLLPAASPGTRKTSLLASVDLYGLGTLGNPRANGRIELRTETGPLVELRSRFDRESIYASLASRDADLDPLMPILSPEIQTVRGRLNSNLEFEGDWEELDYHGTLNAAAAELRFSAFSTRYRDFAVGISGHGKELRLDSLRAKSGRGTLEADGFLNLARGHEAEALKLRALLKNFEALADETMRVDATGELRLALDRSNFTFGGDLRISGGTLRLPEGGQDDEVESLAPLADVVYAPEAEKREGLLDRLKGTVRVDVPGQFWVRSSDMQLELRANLLAGINPEGEVFVTGPVHGVRGHADFFGRHFELRRALLDFKGDPTEPVITAEALYRAQPYSIVVVLKGNLDEVKPSLRSDPAGLSEEESIGVLLTGSPDYQRTGGGASASGVATGYLVGQLKEKLGSKLPFDTLTAETVSDDTNGSIMKQAGQTSIEIGKYLTDRIFVKLGRVFGTRENEPINRLTLDYRLSDRWSIETSQTDQGRSALDVLWTLNY